MDTDLVKWGGIEDAADQVFSIWVGQPELKWAKTAWEKLQDAGLTSFSSEIERHQVALRFLVLGGIYHDFCDVAWQERSEPAYGDWVDSLDLDPFILGMLYGKLCNFDLEEEINNFEATELLIEHFRKELVVALKEQFRGVNGLYESLWKSREGVQEQIEEDVDPDEYEDAFLPATWDKAEAYEWVLGGCCKYR